MQRTPQEQKLIELWMERPSHMRCVVHVLSFTQLVETEHPELLPADVTDSYQYLMSLLWERIEDVS